MQPNEISIAITVYDRRNYLWGAIRSALAQAGSSLPHVVVVEDCGPDAKLEKDTLAEYGDRIRYVRNSSRRGLSDNWNACIEACRTPWLCILHDDDLLEPNFVTAMNELSAAAPDRALYYGLCRVIDAGGMTIGSAPPPADFHWQEMDLEACAHYDPVCFPAQLFNVEAARQLDGFRPQSRYCADWEMWFRLALHFGAVATNRIIANYREHHMEGRGTTDADLRGRRYAYVNMQRRRHFAWLRSAGRSAAFDRAELQAESPLPIRFLILNARGFSDFTLRYNAGLLYYSRPPHLAYRLFQLLVGILSWRSLRIISQLFHTNIRRELRRA
jgi:glycosyltransferase involved in cell wall biosynthesis